MRKLGITLAGLSTILGSAAFAIGLGEIRVESSLGQPLVADVPLLSLDKVSAERIKAHLASKESFERVGLERPLYLDDLKFQIMQDKDGQPIVRISTQNAVNRSYMSFLLNVQTPSGKLYREYTLFLDPPGYADELDAEPYMRARTHAASTQPKVEQSSTARAKPKHPTSAQHAQAKPASRSPHHAAQSARKQPAEQHLQATHSSATAQSAQVVAHHPSKQAVKKRQPPQHAANLSHPKATVAVQKSSHQVQAAHKTSTSHVSVKHHATKHPQQATQPHRAKVQPKTAKPFKRFGETLPAVVSKQQVWDIARHISRRYQLPMAQVEIAILTSNEAAFPDNNLNGIQVGKPLYIPTLAEIKEIPADIAQREKQAEDRAWRAHKPTQWLPELVEVSLGRTATTMTLSAQAEHEQAVKAAAKRKAAAKKAAELAAAKAKAAAIKAEATRLAAENSTMQTASADKSGAQSPQATHAPSAASVDANGSSASSNSTPSVAKTTTQPHFGADQAAPVERNMASTQVSESDSTLDALRTELTTSMNALGAAKQKNDSLQSEVKALKAENQSLHQQQQSQAEVEASKPSTTTVAANAVAKSATDTASAHQKLVQLAQSTLISPSAASQHSGGTSLMDMNQWGTLGYAGLLAMAGIGAGVFWRRRRRYHNAEDLYEADFDADEVAVAASEEPFETQTADSALDEATLSTEQAFVETAASEDAFDMAADETMEHAEAALFDGLEAEDTLAETDFDAAAEFNAEAEIDFDANASAEVAREAGNSGARLDETELSLHVRVSDSELPDDDLPQTDSLDAMPFAPTAEAPEDAPPLEFPGSAPSDVPEPPQEAPEPSIDDESPELPTDSVTSAGAQDDISLGAPHSSAATSSGLGFADEAENVASQSQSDLSADDAVAPTTSAFELVDETDDGANADSTAATAEEALEEAFAAESLETSSPQQPAEQAGEQADALAAADSEAAQTTTDSVSADRNVVATKLDLARVYVEMGDTDSARDMLEDVVAFGDDEQKAEAQRLLDEIS